MLRTMRRLKPYSSEMDMRVWLQKHTAEKEDQEFSRLQETSWDPYKPGSSDSRSQRNPQFLGVSAASGRGAPVRQHSSPLFPGEYRAQRDDVQALTVQSLKDMSSSVRNTEKFTDKNTLLLRVPTLDYEKIEELVSNLFPYMERDETNALLTKVYNGVFSFCDQTHRGFRSSYKLFFFSSKDGSVSSMNVKQHRRKAFFR